MERCGGDCGHQQTRRETEADAWGSHGLSSACSVVVLCEAASDRREQPTSMFIGSYSTTQLSVKL